MTYLFLIADAPGFCTVFRGKACCKNGGMIAVILCDQCESLVLCDTDTGSTLTVYAEGSTSSVRPPACLSSALFSTSGSSLPRTEALRSIPRHAFGLK